MKEEQFCHFKHTQHLGGLFYLEWKNYARDKVNTKEQTTESSRKETQLSAAL